jgi:hypothetical protein
LSFVSFKFSFFSNRVVPRPNTAEIHKVLFHLRGGNIPHAYVTYLNKFMKWIIKRFKECNYSTQTPSKR